MIRVAAVADVHFGLDSGGTLRPRIERLSEQQARGGYALIPLSMYFKDGRVKVELGVCKGKTGVDKREDIAEREAKREMDRARRSRG